MNQQVSADPGITDAARVGSFFMPIGPARIPNPILFADQLRVFDTGVVMDVRSQRRLAVILSLILIAICGQVAAQSPSEQLHSATTLDLRTVTVFSESAVQIDDPVHRSLFSETPDGVVRIGQLETDALAHIEHVEIGTEQTEPIDEDTVENDEDTVEDLGTSRYDLWLRGTDDGLRLQVADTQGDMATEPANILGTIPLTHRSVTRQTPTLFMGFVPTGADGGDLLVRWGNHEWAVDVQFAEPRQALRRRRLSGEGTQRTFDFDSRELQLSSRLSQRNIATVTLAGGPRLSVVFPKDLKVQDRDFAHLVSVETGSVVRVTAAAVTRLDIDIPIQFGDLVLDTGNVGLRDSPGAYGIWLKRAANGWKLVFNDEPDAWGTQHNPELDLGEVELQYTQSLLAGDSMSDALRDMSASVVMTGTDEGRFVLVWGPHEWTADFTVVR